MKIHLLHHVTGERLAWVLPEETAAELTAFVTGPRPPLDLAAILGGLPVISEAREILRGMSRAEVSGGDWTFPVGEAVIGGLAEAVRLGIGSNPGRTVGAFVGVATAVPVLSWLWSVSLVSLHAYIGLPIGYWRGMPEGDAQRLSDMVAQAIGPFCGLQLPVS